MLESSVQKKQQKLRSSHLEEYMAKLPILRDRLSWGRKEIESHQIETLKSLLYHASKHSPWYNDRLQHIDIEAFTIEDLKKIPSMTKKDLMDNWDQIITVPGLTLDLAKSHLQSAERDNYFDDTIRIVASGGTSGATGYFAYDWDAWPQHMLGITRAYLRGDGATDVRSASVSADNNTHISYALGETFSNPEKPVRKIPISLPISTIVKELNSEQPDILHVYPSVLPALFEEVIEGRLVIEPKVLLCTSEVFEGWVREKARIIWPTLSFVLDSWSATETSGTFASFSAEGGFHISEDLNVIEPIYEEGERAFSKGVLITNLYNKALPLIRYKIDDEFEFDEGECASGIAYKKVKSVRGRVDHYLNFENNVSVHPFAIEAVLAAIDGLLEYQISKLDNGVLITAVTTKTGQLDHLIKDLKKSLSDSGLVEPVVKIDYVSSIERNRAGKRPKVII